MFKYHKTRWEFDKVLDGKKANLKYQTESESES